MRGLLVLALFLSPLAGAQTPAPAKSPLRWQNFAQPAQATPPPATRPQPARPEVETTSDYLTRMDSDGDGRVSQAEYLDWMGYAFDARDANRDGTLTADELPGGKGQPVTREQHRQGLAERFRKQDTDRSDWLSAKELAAPPQ